VPPAGATKPHHAPPREPDSEEREPQPPVRRTGGSTVDLRNRRVVESRDYRHRAGEIHQREPKQDPDETRELAGGDARLAMHATGPSPAPPRGKARGGDARRKRDVSVLTDQVREATHRSQKTQRLVKLIIALLLISAGGAIVAVVGLTGPSLDDPSKGLKKDPLPGTAPVLDAEVRGRPVEEAGGAATPVTPDRSRAADLGEPAGDGRGNLKVSSTPSGAAVHLDGVFQCETPCTIEELEDGRVYLLSIRRKNYVSWSSLVDLQRRRRVTANAFLSEEPDARRVGYLSFRSTPVAEVLVDGKEIGRVTSEGRIPLPPGKYEITLAHPKRPGRARNVVTIVAGQTTVLTVKKL
jgi:hypothetical protein